jgi:hypothetical protein
VLLAAGTTTITVKQIEAHTSENSWRTLNLCAAILDQYPPQVRILPAKVQGGEVRLALVPGRKPVVVLVVEKVKD